MGADQRPLGAGERGFDQAELLARHIGAPARGARAGGCSIATVGRWPADRSHPRERLAGSVFRARPDVHDRRVLVVDDVVTTGATLTHAAHALEAAGAAEVLLVRRGVARRPRVGQRRPRGVA